MDTLTLIVIDTDKHSDTNDIIICYMIVFWELNSYWGNFKIFLHGEWNEKIWIVWIITIWVNRYFYVNRFFYVEQFFLCEQICWTVYLFIFYVEQILCEQIFCTGFTQIFCTDGLLNKKNSLYLLEILNRLIYWYWARKPNFFII